MAEFHMRLILTINSRFNLLLRPENYLVGENPSYSVPKEVWFLCDLMQSLDLGQENLFLQPGDRCPARPLKGEFTKFH